MIVQNLENIVKQISDLTSNLFAFLVMEIVLCLLTDQVQTDISLCFSGKFTILLPRAHAATSKFLSSEYHPNQTLRLHSVSHGKYHGLEEGETIAFVWQCKQISTCTLTFSYASRRRDVTSDKPFSGLYNSRKTKNAVNNRTNKLWSNGCTRSGSNHTSLRNVRTNWEERSWSGQTSRTIGARRTERDMNFHIFSHKNRLLLLVVMIRAQWFGDKYRIREEFIMFFAWNKRNINK